MAVNIRVEDEFDVKFTFSEGEYKREEYMIYCEHEEGKLELLGSGVEDAGTAMNPDTEDKNDILGQRYFRTKTYKPSMTLDPVLLDGDSKYAQKIGKMYLYGKTGSELELPYIIVLQPYKDAEGKSWAYRQNASITLDTFAGGLDGINQPHTLNFIGKRTYGTVDMSAAYGEKKFEADTLFA